jgi:hypothetical protein
MKKALYLAAASLMMLGFTSCEFNYFPSDELNGSVLMSDESGVELIVDGCYAMLKDEYEYIEYASSNTYVRHFLQMAEFPADNTCLSGRTTDPLYQATCYKMTDNLKNVGLFWWVGYKVAFTANTIIEGVEEGKSAKYDQLLGEAYFLRAMVHFHMACIFAKPYSHGRDNMGIVLRTSTNTETTTRATVGEVYDQIAKDLRKAAELMNAPRGNAGYASKNAALGLLSRVYLYEEKNDSVIAVINEMGDPTAYLDQNYPAYFANALSSKETLFAVAHTAVETRGQGSIGSMYINDGIGWGEVYCSDPLLNLYNRYPEDKRLTYIIPNYASSGKDIVYFPIPSADEFRSDMTAEVKTDAQGKYCEIDGTKYRINEKTVNGEYTEYYVTYGGEQCPARLDKALMQRNTFPNYYVSKFSYQDGDPMLSSPVFLRWGEVLLNRAEAYAKTGQNAKALDDVNAIRARAGIPAAGMFSTGNMHGYTDVLDVVLDERRMELAFEGHRMFDVYRNKRDMDRRFGGVQTWEVVKWDDPRIQYPIPYGETSVSGIPQNPGY